MVSNYRNLTTQYFVCIILKDSRGSMHRSSGPAGTFPTTSAQPITADCQSPSQPSVTTNVTRLECGPLQFVENECSNAFVVDCCATVGSLSSVQSAPPVPLADLTANNGTLPNATNSTRTGLVNFEIGHPDSPSRRPISLALDSNGLSLSKSMSRPLFNHQTSEADEEDNENLLTVSSLTARPLIAKSRELRTTK